jgi:hypothetical protein
VKTTLLAALLLLGSVLPAGATRSAENYPKVLTYTSGMNELSPATRDSLSWYDVLVCMDRPETIRDMRSRNPDQRYLWQIQPQYVDGYSEEDPWWLPDTLWSPKRLAMYYMKANDWYLRDVNGQIVTDGIHLLVNWTRYCPVGTYGTAKGLRAAEWMASVCLPTAALSGRGELPPWSWDGLESYNGYMFEILADCLGSYGWQNYQYADPNRDGTAEGVSHACSMGGTNDPLSVLFREENEEFYARLTSAFPPEFVFTINENTSPVGPWWRTRLSGMKFENWMRGCCPAWGDWWDWFYGITPPGQVNTNWGAGYLWAETEFDKPVADRLKGWDLSYIVTWREPGKSEAENLRQMRFGLGTTLLGDGYFDYSLDDRRPQWQPEFDWDFGDPLDEFAKEIYSGDTLYVRSFSRGMVEVNPYSHPVRDVPLRDSRFTFWLPVEDLAAQAAGTDAIRVTWTAPTGEHNDADSYDLRYALAPITIASWDAATEYEGNPVIAAPGEAVAVDVGPLPRGQTYHLAVRTTTRGRPEPVLSNPAQFHIEAEPDTIPPDMIDDLRATALGSTSITVGWTAVGDDGHTGTAARTLMRILARDTIRTEADWERAGVVGGLSNPRPPGYGESHRISGLASSTTYGIAVRAQDEMGQLSPLHPPFLARTTDPPPPPPVDHTPPATIADADGEAEGAGRIRIRWSAPGDDGWEGRASSYLVRFLRGRAIVTEGDWLAGSAPSVEPPDPGAPHSQETMLLTDLTPGEEYGIAIRAVDDAGNVGGISNPLLRASGAEEPPPPPPADTIPPAAIDDLAVGAVTESTAVLEWMATGDDGDQGVAASVEVGILQGRAIDSESDWLTATHWTVGGTAPISLKGLQTTTAERLLSDTEYGVAARGRDEAGNIGALGPPLTFWTAAPPPPPPPAQPPGAITDLRLLSVGTDTARVAWSAPGDDGLFGRASRYLVRVRIDGDIVDEEDWLAGTIPDTSGLGRPAPAGAAESWTLRGLNPGVRYALAVRAEDDSSLVGALSNPLAWETSTPPPPPPGKPGPIVDLTSAGRGESWLLLSWTAPEGVPAGEPAARYLIAASPTLERIDSEDAWIAAGPRADGLPAPAVPGTAQSWRFESLAPGTAYAIALRAEDSDGHLGDLGSSIRVTTEALPDTIVDPPPPPVDRPPAPIRDLVATDVDTTSLRLTWTAVGEDSLEGIAERYELRILPGARIASEPDWLAAIPVAAVVPEPGLAGASEEAWVDGLTPGAVYGFAVRAFDQAGQPSALEAGPIVTLLVPPPPPEDPIPPVAATGLIVDEITPGSARVRWSHPNGPGDPAGPARFVLKIATAPIDGTTWNAARRHASPPDPAGAGTQVGAVWDGLEERTTYWTAVRAQSADSLWSPLVTASFTTTAPIDLAPPATPSGLRSAGSDGQGRIRLEWEASPEPDLNGYRLYARPFGGTWTSIYDELIPADATSATIPPDAGEEFALTAIDHAGNESALSAAIAPVVQRRLALRGPFPHPITDGCRFEVDLPEGVAAGDVLLRILDAGSREIRRIHGGESGGPGSASIAWDRRDGTGRPAAPGFYLAIVEAGERKISRRIFAAP